jgi:cell wall-associated NlpC family hydrolase
MRQRFRDWFIVILYVVSSLTIVSCHSSHKATTSSSAPALKKADKKAAYTAPTQLRRSRKKDLRDKYAVVLNISPSKIKDFRLYNFIDDWYGVDYKYGGTDLNGVDCSGFAQQLYKHVYGTEIVRTSAQQYAASRHFRRKRKLREGDLVFFKTTGDGISHVGVYLANNYFVHASPKGVAISNLNEQYWVRSFAAIGKVRKKKA